MQSIEQNYLDNFEWVISEEVTTRIDIENFQYHLNYKIIPNQPLFILLNGAINRDVKAPPCFQRSNWAKELNLSYISINDPLTLISDVSLAWYLGTENHNVIEKISMIIESAHLNIKFTYSNLYFYGSSGGGFAAIKLAALFQGTTAIVLNPQINIFDYRNDDIRKFFSVYFENEEAKDIEILKAGYYNNPKFSIIEFLKQQAHVPNLFYRQNIFDLEHYYSHFLKLKQFFDTIEIIKQPDTLIFETYKDKRRHNGISDLLGFRNEIKYILASNSNVNQIQFGEDFLIDKEPKVFHFEMSEKPNKLYLKLNLLLTSMTEHKELEPKSKRKAGLVLFDFDFEGLQSVPRDILLNDFHWSSTHKRYYKYLSLGQNEMLVSLDKSIKIRSIAFTLWSCNYPLKIDEDYIAYNLFEI